MRYIRAVLLDLDGVLVKSERLVHKASTPLVNEVLTAKMVTRQYDANELRERYLGLGFSRIMAALGREHGFEITADELAQLMRRELDLVVAMLETEVEATPGADSMLTQVCDWGLQRAVVSSSELRRIHACVRRTGLGRYISQENLFSATDSLPKPEGKPSPAIYQFARQALRAASEDCLAVEDSPTGVLAAVADEVAVLGFVGAEESASKREELARSLIAAGAVAVFDNWTSVLEWIRPRLLA